MSEAIYTDLTEVTDEFTPEKFCSGCQTWHPLTLEHWAASIVLGTNDSSNCRKAMAAYHRARKAERLERKRERESRLRAMDAWQLHGLMLEYRAEGKPVPQDVVDRMATEMKRLRQALSALTGQSPS
jgi:hypothetical protein